MPLLILVILVGAILLIPKTAEGFVRGQAVTLQVESIEDFGCVLRSDAARAWNEMKSDAAAEGVTLTPKGPNSAFRTHEQQETMLAERPDYAAQVDHSPHQAGIAVDVDLTKSRALDWLLTNGPDYGWHPLSSSGAKKEPWHFEFLGAPT